MEVKTINFTYGIEKFNTISEKLVSMEVFKGLIKFWIVFTFISEKLVSMEVIFQFNNVYFFILQFQKN